MVNKKLTKIISVKYLKQTHIVFLERIKFIMLHMNICATLRILMIKETPHVASVENLK